MYGSVRIDFAAVGAPVYRSDWIAPPTSGDPVYPGIIVFTSLPRAPNQLAEVKFLIGTLSNRRDGTSGLDGAGIHLDLRHATPPFFSGTWDRAGLLADGSGYFCLRWLAE